MDAKVINNDLMACRKSLLKRLKRLRITFLRNLVRFEIVEIHPRPISRILGKCNIS